jgi:hypothetical protein
VIFVLQQLVLALADQRINVELWGVNSFIRWPGQIIIVMNRFVYVPTTQTNKRRWIIYLAVRLIMRSQGQLKWIVNTRVNRVLLHQPLSLYFIWPDVCATLNKLIFCSARSRCKVSQPRHHRSNAPNQTWQQTPRFFDYIKAHSHMHTLPDGWPN